MALTFKGGIPVKEIETACGFDLRLPELCDDMLSGDSPLTAKGLLKVCIGTSGLTPDVKAGDTVMRGQLIADASGDKDCPVYSSVSGSVCGVTESTVTVLTDTAEEEVMLSPFEKPLKDADTDEIVARIRECGIMSQGKPLHQRIKDLVGTTAIVINCASCAPFPSGDMFEAELDPRAVCGGAKILLKALSVPYAVFAVTENNIHILKPLLNAVSDDKLFRISELKAKYPQQNEALLYYSLSGKELVVNALPSPMPAGIFSLSDCIAVYNAFVYGKPFIDTTVSVYGSGMKKPKVVTVPIGAYLKDIVAYCGAEAGCDIYSGTLLSASKTDDDACITGEVSSLIVDFPKKKTDADIECCIGCGKCTAVCPMRIMPIAIAQSARKESYDKCKALGAQYCIECGSCSFICPQGIDICGAVISAKEATVEECLPEEPLPEETIPEEPVSEEPVSEEPVIEEESPKEEAKPKSSGKGKKSKKGGGKKKK